MVVLPRLMTVDPTGELARLARAAVAILDRPTVQIDVPASLEALDEFGRANFDLVIAALELDIHMRGADFAMRVKQANPQTSVIVIAHQDDPDPLNDEARAAAPFLYLTRPFDGAQFMRAITAGLNGRDVLSTQLEPAARAAAAHQPVGHEEIGAIPSLDVRAASKIIDGLLNEVSPMAVVLSNRAGDVLHETGAVGYFDRQELTAALMPSALTTFEMSKLVGGKASSLGFFDGERFDVFVLSIGIHHFLTLIFDGTQGRSQFGGVNRYGRRAAEDLGALIGASAFMTEAERDARATLEMQRASQEQITVDAPPYVAPPLEPVADGKGGRRKRRGATALLDPGVLDGRDNHGNIISESKEPLILRSDEVEQVSIPEAPLMEPIPDLDLDLLDPKVLASLDLNEANALFDLDHLSDIVSADSAPDPRKDIGKLSYDDARELGIIP